MSKHTNAIDARTRRTSSQRDVLLQQFRTSGGTQAEFCRKHGLHPATFSAWCRREPRELPAPAFHEIVISRPHAPLEVLLADGAIVRVVDPAWLTPLLRSLREASPC